MAFKKWRIETPDKVFIKELANDCDADPFTAAIAVGRGIRFAEDFEQFLDREPLLCDPRELADIELAAETVNAAIIAGEKIAVFGDYDCDGVVATALLSDYLTERGAEVVGYIPNRLDEGYGMNTAAVEKLAGDGVKLIVTVDNGIACHLPVARANELGVRVVVTDHHLPGETLPEAVAVVDPHRVDCPSEFKEVCGAEVAFKLVCVMEDREPEEVLPRFADLLAVATVGDIMPLQNENRSIVWAGLQKLKENPRVGLSALMNVAGLDREKLTATNLSFGIVPRVNAIGRMDSAMRAVELLRTENIGTALALANEIETKNAERQQVERKIFAEVCEKIERENLAHHRVIVVSGAGWHIGVVGIAAARVMEKYGKPALVLAENGEVAEGSGRSIAGFSLYKALEACKEHLLKFGGHELAAGMGLRLEDLAAFRAAINRYAATQPPAIPTLNIDLRLKPEALSVDMVGALEPLEPFGMGNPAPLFGLLEVTLENIIPLSGGKHLKLMFTKNGTPFQALLFGVTPPQFCFQKGDVLDLAATLGENIYGGVRSLSVVIKALRISGYDQDRLFDDLFAYDDYLCGATLPAEKIPSREEIGSVYRKIAKENLSAERLKYLGLLEIGFAKTEIALTVLRELNLVTLRDGVYSVNAGAQKTALENAPTYRKLLQGGMAE